MKYIKDVIIYLFTLVILVVVGYNYLKDIEVTDLLNELSSYVGTVVIILFGIIGIMDFALSNGLKFLVPKSYENYVYNKERKLIKSVLNDFLHTEIGFLTEYGNSRIAFFLEQLGLSQNDFLSLQSKLITIKLLPIKDCVDAREKLKKIIYECKLIVNQEELESNRLIYKKVKYFINLANIVYIDDYCAELVDCMGMLISETIPNELNGINKIIVPYDGNNMLGLELSKKLGKSIINVTKSPKIFSDEMWIGNFNGTNNEGIVILDVLVTGDQVLKSIKSINSHCVIKYVFALINRTDHDGKEVLERAGYKVFSLMDICDDDIKKELENLE